MKLIKPSYEIISSMNGEEILKQIELAARTCYKSEGKIDIEHVKQYVSLFRELPKEIDAIQIVKHCKSARELIPKLISRGHDAMSEFGGMITVKFICDRGVSHELVRHRMASFAQESTRYCNYGNDENIQFIIPCWLDIPEHVCKHKEDIEKISNFEKKMWMNSMLLLESAYNVLIVKGWSPQQARAVLPNSLKTEINVSANIREWRHIFKLRTSKAAHPQMRELMCPLLDEFKTKIPILFDDINNEK